jgi:hypothetical protein
MLGGGTVVKRNDLNKRLFINSAKVTSEGASTLTCSSFPSTDPRTNVHLSTTRRPPLARETQPDHEIGGDRDGPPRRGPITPFSARVETVLGLQRTAGNRAFAGTLSESGPSDLGQPGVGSADGYLLGERGFADIDGRRMSLAECFTHFRQQAVCKA